MDAAESLLELDALLVVVRAQAKERGEFYSIVHACWKLPCDHVGDDGPCVSSFETLDGWLRHSWEEHGMFIRLSERVRLRLPGAV